MAWIYLQLNADQSNTLFFTKLPFRVDTGDSERVAVDHVAKARPASEDESPSTWSRSLAAC